MVPVDLAAGKTASASSDEGEQNLPGLAFDGDPDTRWCASGPSVPQLLQVDLGTPEDLTGCQILWERADAAYGYKVEGSVDAKSWKVLSDQSDAPAGPQERRLKFKAGGIRYVRLNITKLPEGGWASVYDVEVFGKQLVAKARLARTAVPGGNVKAPPGFDMTVFAAPPDVSYATCVAAAPTGPVFIGIDEDGSLGKQAGQGVDRPRDRFAKEPAWPTSSTSSRISTIRAD